ncbi:MAG: hypothetical protein M0Z50_00785 [Planctomycetia bacterium]|nr:hypothetical protein [Planctomycetia bacterium]
MTGPNDDSSADARRRTFSDLREHTAEASGIYQATITMIAIFDGFIFVALLQMLNTPTRLTAWAVGVVWLLTMALMVFTYAMLCFHVVGYRIINYFSFFFPGSRFIVAGRLLMNLGVLAMFSALAAMLCSRGAVALAFLAGVVEAGALGAVVFSLIGKRLCGDNVVDVDGPSFARPDLPC